MGENILDSTIRNMQLTQKVDQIQAQIPISNTITHPVNPTILPERASIIVPAEQPQRMENNNATIEKETNTIEPRITRSMSK